MSSTPTPTPPLDLDAALAEIDRLRAELTATHNNRLISAIFGHHKDAPRPFALHRRSDVSGISGAGVVAEGAAFSDGTAVLRWLSDWPTSVVFHDRGMEAIEAIHGHGGATQIVWLSDELEPLAEMEAERDRLRADVEALLPAARAYLAALAADPLLLPALMPPLVAAVRDVIARHGGESRG